MIELKTVHGADGWLDGPDGPLRRAELDTFCLDHALDPAQLAEEWSEDHQLLARIVAVEGERIVATAMIVLDPDHAQAPVRIFGQAALQGFATAFVIEAMEDALVDIAAPDPIFEAVEGTFGRRIPIPDHPHLSRQALATNAPN